MKKNILAFTIPIIIFLLAMIIGGYFPFGEGILRTFDARIQYPGFFIGLQNFSTYSFNVGLGMNYYGTAIYYLFSPLNILIYLFKTSSFDIFYSIIILLKIGLCGLFMNMFLTNIKSSRWSVLFSICYALCGFLSTYYYNVMWLDGIYMLPLIMLGINKLVDENKKLLYFVSLTLAIIFNFYIGYMLCIFALIYFIFKLINSKSNKKKTIVKFIMTSLLAGLTAAFVIIPAFYALMGGKASGFSEGFTEYFSLNKNALAILYNLTPASFAIGDQSYGPVQVYSSILVLVSVILVFFNKKLDIKYKASCAIVILFFLASFTFNLIDYAWQFFQKPIWWQSRYSFTFSAFLITIAYTNFNSIEPKNINIKPLIFVVPVLVLGLIGSYLAKVNMAINLLSIIFLVFSLLISVLYGFFTINKTKMFNIFIIMFLIIELSINTFYSLKQNFTSQRYTDYWAESTNLNNIVDSIKEADETFYRTEFMSFNIYNDGLVHNYNGINYFNSVRNQKIVDFAEYKLDFSVGSHTSVIMNRFDPYLLSLMNFKYIVGSKVDYLKHVADSNGYSIYENEHPLSIGFMIYEDNVLEGNYFNVVTDIFQSMTHIEEPLFLNSEPYLMKTWEKNENNCATYKFDNDYLIAPLDTNFFKQFVGYTIGEYNYNFNSSYLQVNSEDEITFTYNPLHIEDDNKIQFKLLDVNTYANYVANLQENILVLDNNSKHLLEGSIEVNDKQVLFLSIPYEEGFIIKVDGKQVDYFPLYETFIGLNLGSGTHNITIDYSPKGLNIGIIISAISCLVGALYIYKTKGVCYNKGTEEVKL